MRCGNTNAASRLPNNDRSRDADATRRATHSHIDHRRGKSYDLSHRDRYRGRNRGAYQRSGYTAPRRLGNATR
jgi:hypothetical protein